MIGAGRAPVERSITRIRLLVMLVGALLVIPHGLDAVGVASIAVLVAAVATVALARLIMGRARPAVNAGLMVGVDTAVVMAFLGIRSVEPGDPTTILLMLPLLEAAFLLGLLATGAVWFTMAFTAAAWLTWSWDGTTELATGTSQLLGLLLLLSLPAAHLSSHLVDTVAGYERARDVAERRAGILTSLLDATSGMTTLDASTALRETVAAAATMVSGRALVTEALVTGSPPFPMAGPYVDVRVLAASFDAAEHVTVERAFLERAATADGVGVADGTNDGFMVSLGGDHGAGVLWETGSGSDDPLVREGLELLASHLRVSLSIIALDEQTRAEAATWERRAEIDHLTGLFNRGAVTKRLQSTLALGEEGIAVLFIDLDRFKAINDEHGHDVGDEVLVALAARLVHLAPESAVVARLGGDEFVMVVDLPAGVDPAVVVTPLVARIRDEMRQPVALVRGFDVQLGASVGTAVAAPGSGSSAAELLRVADTRMYETKRGRRSTDRPPPGLLQAGEHAGGVPLGAGRARR